MTDCSRKDNRWVQLYGSGSLVMGWPGSLKSPYAINRVRLGHLTNDPQADGGAKALRMVNRK